MLRFDSIFYFNGQSFVDKRIKETACRSYFLVWQIIISDDQKSMLLLAKKILVGEPEIQKLEKVAGK